MQIREDRNGGELVERKAEKEGKGTRLRRDRSGVEGVGWGGVRHTGFWFDWIAVGPRDWEEGRRGCWTGAGS